MKKEQESPEAFKSKIEDYINANLNTYKDASRIYADFKDELGTTEEYNGRQIFELLQNAEDAKTDAIEFDLNTKEHVLTVSNKGEAFSSSGIHSLMIAHLSSKDKINYIGNKGLGFRSILNWAESVSIESNNCRIIFSEKIAAEYLNTKLNQTIPELNQFKTKDHYNDDVIPIPILSLPEIKDCNSNSDWVTRIIIKYRTSFQDDIIAQLENFSDKVLLFLTNIKNIKYIKDFVVIKDIHAEGSTGNSSVSHIKLGDKEWTVFSSKNPLPEEYQDKKLKIKEHYCIKIAVSEEYDGERNYLYSYFPTQISIALPCVIHATLDIDSSRKTLNESEKNEYIISQIPNVFFDIINYFKKNERKNNITNNWNLFRLLKASSTNSDNVYISNFYYSLNTKIKNDFEIFPCIDGNYRKLQDVKYYSDALSKRIRENYSSFFPDMLIETLAVQNKGISNLLDSLNKYSSNIFDENIETICKSHNFSNEQRAEFIDILLSINCNKRLFSLLLNNSTEPIDSSYVAYTPSSSDEITLPSYMHIELLNKSLYEYLLTYFRITESDAKNKARDLVAKIRSIVNIQPYDFSNLTDRILSEEKRQLESDISVEKKVEIIKETVSVLFNNFKNSNTKIDVLNKDVLLLSRNKIDSQGFVGVPADTLYLSKTYLKGKLTEEVYGDVLTENQYLIDKTFWGFEEEDSELVDRFFEWLGVNESIITESKKIEGYCKFKDKYLDEFYKQGLFDNVKITSYVSNVQRIQDDNLLLLQKLDRTKLLALLKNNEVVSSNILVHPTGKVIITFANSPSYISLPYSYIIYQIRSLKLYDSVFLEGLPDELFKIIGNDSFIDYDWLEKHVISREEAKALLINLGAKKSFESLNADTIFSIIDKQYELYKDTPEKISQKSYQIALDSLDKILDKGIVFEPNLDIHYCCKQGSKYVFEKANGDIFYSDNSILPKKIMNRLNILNIGPRVGEEKVKRCFGIQPLKSSNCTIVSPNQLDEQTTLFNERFDVRRLYILIFRLQKINKNEEQFSKPLSNLRFSLIKSGKYNFKSINEELDNYDFLIDSNIAYIKVPELPLDSLIQESLFLDAFAECMCIILKVSDSNDLKNDFRRIIKENDIKDLRHIIELDMPQGTYEKCASLLNIKFSYEYLFWKKVFEFLNLSFPEHIVNSEQLQHYIQDEQKLGFVYDYSKIDYESFDTPDTLELLTMLKNKGIPIENVISENGLFHIHSRHFKNLFYSKQEAFSNILYDLVLMGNIEQEKFVGLCLKFTYTDKFNDYVCNYKYTINPDYEQLFNEYIFSNLGIDLTQQYTNRQIKNLYKDLFSDFDENDLPNEIRSLLYFEGNEKKIKQYLEIDVPKNTATPDNNGSKPLDIVEGHLSKSGKGPRLPSQRKGEFGVVGSLSDKNKKNAGKSAEQQVLESLSNKYGKDNVIQVSGNSDTPFKNDKEHFDIAYRTSVEEEWRYLEVKKSDGSQLILTSEEKNFGCKKENSDKYDFALVDGEKISIIRNVFNFINGESFEDNSSFDISPKDYYLTFKIDIKKDSNDD